MPAFLFEGTDDQREGIFKSAEDLIDHTRYLIAERAAGIFQTNELRKLRGEPNDPPYSDQAPKVTAIWHSIIAWAKTATPGMWFRDSFAGNYTVFCLNNPIPDNTKIVDPSPN